MNNQKVYKDKKFDNKGKKNHNSDKSGKRPESRKDSQDSERFNNMHGEPVEGYGKSNDPAWYNKQSQLVKDVTAIPFAYQLGKPVQVEINPQGITADFDIPGVMAISTIPVPGVAQSASDGVNLAATGLFQYIRKNLSTYASYAPADVMMCVLGIDNIYALYSHIKRAFGMANLYSSVNLYYNKRLFETIYSFSDATYKEFINNINAYRGRFNNLIYKASALYLPTDFTITARHAWEYTNLFIDGDSVKSQLYAYTPAAIYMLDEKISDQGTALTPAILSKHTNGGAEFVCSMELLLTYFDQAIEAYRSSDSMNVIQADMRRAFEGRQYYGLTYLDENYMVLPVKSAEVMSQIENTKIFPDLNFGLTDEATKSWNITQSVNHNTLTFTPSWTVEQMIEEHMNGYMGGLILNFHWDNPSQDDILVATRNLGVVIENGPIRQLRTCGVDVIVGCDMCTGNVIQPVDSGVLLNTSISRSDLAKILRQWAVFDWAPILWLATDETGDSVEPICDFDNFTVINPDLLTRMNDNILMNMWSIPQLGTFNG